MKAGNLYIMEFDFTYIGNDYQYQNKNVDTWTNFLSSK